MRIKQNKLTTKPVKSYYRFVNGIHVMVLVYDKPIKCVNVITQSDGKEIRHCYPLTDEQYSIYIADSAEEQQRLIAKGGKIYGKNICK